MSELIRLERRVDERFKTIDLAIIENPSLSWKAKGLHTYLISRPNGWKLWHKDLEQRSTDGKSSLAAAVEELKTAGYLRIERRTDLQGKVTGFRWIIAQSPELMESELRPDPDFPDLGFPDPDFPDPGDRPRSKKQSSKDQSSKEQEGKQPQATRIVQRVNDLRRMNWKWASFRPFSASHAKNVEHIHGRLKDGFSEAQLILVAEYLAAKDGGDEKSRQFFDCVTPFRVSNFERFLAMAEDWDARGRPSFNGDHRHPGTSRPKAYYLGERQEEEVQA